MVSNSLFLHICLSSDVKRAYEAPFPSLDDKNRISLEDKNELQVDNEVILSLESCEEHTIATAFLVSESSDTDPEYLKSHKIAICGPKADE